MEPHEPTPSQTRESRRRSRSPPSSNDQREAPRRGRKRPSRFENLSPSTVERIRQKHQASASNFNAKFEAERTRRRALSPDQRLKEDGDQLRQKIEAEVEMAVSLEISRSTWARCRADDDCVYMRANASSGNAIRTDYRICVHGVPNIEWFGRTKHYYHVPCFSRMVDLKDLVPSKFKMDGSFGRWGLMVEKWFEHAGRIDLDKIAVFLEDFMGYEAKDVEWNTEYINWSLTHRRNCTDELECKCPAQPRAPEKPELEDYTTEGRDECTLLDVLEHPLAEKVVEKSQLEQQWMITPRGSNVGGPAYGGSRVSS